MAGLSEREHAQLLARTQMTEGDVIRRAIVRWTICVAMTSGGIVLLLGMLFAEYGQGRYSNAGWVSVVVVTFGIMFYNSAKNLAKAIHPKDWTD